MASISTGSRPNEPPTVPGLLLTALVFGLACGQTGAADKNGVAPTAISLPGGPGSAEGLGESFQPSLNTGTPKYRVSIQVPPGTAGHAPGLTLVYEGGDPKGVLGVGWDLPLPYVQRQTDKGIPRYVDTTNGVDDDADGTVDEPDEVDPLINDLREELVPCPEGFFFCENEGAFIRYRPLGTAWEGVQPNGTLMRFGLDDEGRIVDPETGLVFKWLLQQTLDPLGNGIVYSYTNFPGTANRNQKYLATVSYGPGRPPWTCFHFVRFNYGPRNDWSEDGRAGFLIRTGVRLTNIVVGTQGVTIPDHLPGDFNADGIPDVLTRTYSLQYLKGTGTGTYWSFLRQMTVTGADGTTALPPLRFDYNVCDPADILSATGATLGGINEPGSLMDTGLSDLIDLNGDALPDILRTYYGGGAHEARLNLGETNAAGGRAIRWSAPIEVASADGLAWNVDLKVVGANSAHLADMDGDGLADLAYRSPGDDGTVYWFRNTGTNAWGVRQTMAEQDYLPPAPFDDPDVRTADIDFDKRIDIVQSIDVGGTAYYNVWFNLGDLHYSKRVTCPQTNGVMFSWAGADLVDFNGDRVPDLTRVRIDTVEVSAGLGHGRFANTVTVPIPGTNTPFNSDQQAQARLRDINGDGLADLVIERSGPGTLWYWLNLGHYAFGPAKTVTDMPTGTGLSPTIRWADMNGNGSVDLVYCDSEGDPRLTTIDLGELMGARSERNLMVGIDNGTGARTRILYAPSTTFRLLDQAGGRPWPDPLPFPVNVVAAVLVDDSLGHVYTNAYRYHDGYYDGEDKEFRGFASADTMEPGDRHAPTLITRSWFDTGRRFDAMKGKALRRRAEAEEGRAFWDETTVWADPPPVLRLGVNGKAVVFAHPVGKTNAILELGQGEPRIIEYEFAFDAFGNRTREARYGVVTNGDRSAFDDECIVSNVFAINTNQWLLRTVARREVMDEHGTVAARSEHYYDDPTYSGTHWGTVSTGLLTLVKDWIDPGNPTACVSTLRNRYDGFGNIVQILDPLAVADNGVPSPDGGHYREIFHEAAFHQFPTQEIIHVGQGKAPLQVSASFDPALGTLRTTLDFNGHEMKFDYDGLGRLTAIFRQGDLPAWPSAEYDYALGVAVGGSGIVNYVETRELDREPGTRPSHADHYFISRLYTDGTGRTLMTKAEAEGAATSAVPEVVVSDAALFSSRRNPKERLTPFWSDSPGETLPEKLAYEPIESPGWSGRFDVGGMRTRLGLATAPGTSLHCDAMLRPRRTTVADGSFVETVYEALRTIAYDANDTLSNSPHFNTPVVMTSDGLGRVIRVDQIVRLNDDGTPAITPRTWTTVYRYNLNGLRTGVTDPQGNTKTTTYDALGRPTRLAHPDSGTSEFCYDEAGNMVARRDALGHVTTFTYDGANRLLTEDYHDEGLPFSPGFAYTPGLPLSPTNRADVALFYDEPVVNLPLGDGKQATASNVKGKVAYVWDLAGEEHVSYDLRGRLSGVVKRARHPVNNILSSFCTRFTYDVMGRLTRLTYPDNDAVSYVYGEGSLPSALMLGDGTMIISNLDYTASRGMTRVEHGNGMVTRCDYDRRGRLAALETFPAGTPESPVLRVRYDQDPAGNIRSLEDRRPVAVLPAGDPRRNSRVLDYDDLYRLTRTQFSHHAPGQPWIESDVIGCRYDRIGNLLAQTSSIARVERGLPVAALGSLGYGGEWGATGRVGRGTNDPPGPHALSQIQPPGSAPPRALAYDANGNVTTVDGVTNTWDFKNRLAAIETATLRAEYTYDYADRRMIKTVRRKNARPPDHSESVVYVSPSYEVRESGEVVKYVLNGSTRLARLSGFFSGQTNRVQVFPLQEGWNLVSMGVQAEDAAQQLGVTSQGVIEACCRWDPAQRLWVTVTTNALPAGSVFWVKCSTALTAVVQGHYAEPTNQWVTAGGEFIPAPGMEPLPLKPLIEGAGLAWIHQASPRTWDAVFTLAGSPYPGAPPTVPSGGAAFITSTNPALAWEARPDLRIRYYHPDHLGSATVITDARGGLLEEHAFYPSGLRRIAWSATDKPEAYGFCDKEEDGESGFLYFGARYYNPFIGRWLSPDPAGEEGGPNLYAYALNNPLRVVDPNGRQPQEAQGTTSYAFNTDPLWSLFSETGNPNPIGGVFITKGEGDPISSPGGMAKVYQAHRLYYVDPGKPTFENGRFIGYASPEGRPRVIDMGLVQNANDPGQALLFGADVILTVVDAATMVAPFASAGKRAVYGALQESEKAAFRQEMKEIRGQWIKSEVERDIARFQTDPALRQAWKEGANELARQNTEAAVANTLYRRYGIQIANGVDDAHAWASSDIVPRGTRASRSLLMQAERTQVDDLLKKYGELTGYYSGLLGQ